MSLFGEMLPIHPNRQGSWASVPDLLNQPFYWSIEGVLPENRHKQSGDEQCDRMRSCVIDKNFSNCIELVRRQYSGAEHRVIRGIGLISCVYVNVKTGQFWVIDYRIYDPDGDSKTKLDHL
jgi:hypothetical protein